MATPNMRRISAEDAQNDPAPLGFSAKRTAAVHAAYRGVPVTVTMEGANVAEVERLIGSLLERDGWGAAAQPSTRKPAAPKVEPHYADDGSPCCPHHNRPLKGPNQWGKLYCTAKDESGRNGYCDYTTQA